MRVEGATYDDLAAELEQVIEVEIEGNLLRLTEGCDGYFHRELTKAQAEIWVAGLAEIIGRMQA